MLHQGPRFPRFAGVIRRMFYPGTAAVALLLVLGSCGGSTSSTTAPPTSRVTESTPGDTSFQAVLAQPQRGTGETRFVHALENTPAYARPAAILKWAPQLFDTFDKAENATGLQELQLAVQKVDGSNPLLARLPRAITAARNNVTAFLTRSLAGGADRSISEIEHDIDRADEDMVAHGVLNKTPEFYKEQGRLLRAAMSNVTQLATDHRITGPRALSELNRLRSRLTAP
jgi:hypothetical protein